MAAPNQADMKRGLRCLHYLKATESLGIQYTGEDPVKVFCDSNWGGPEENRLSRSGYAVMLNHGAIVFRSILQKVQAQSTAEAEHVALAAATQDAVFVRQMLEEMSVYMRGPIPVLEDNNACIVYANNDMTSQRGKHIDIKYHFIRTMVGMKII